MGPTASGKTAVALEIAAALPCEIVSVDSAQVYRHMDIGTAKPDAETLARAPHHLINIIEPDETYSAARFRDDAQTVMREITERRNIPLHLRVLPPRLLSARKGSTATETTT